MPTSKSWSVSPVHEHDRLWPYQGAKQVPYRPLFKLGDTEHNGVLLPLVDEVQAFYRMAGFEAVSEVVQSLEVLTNDIEQGQTLSGEPLIV